MVGTCALRVAESFELPLSRLKGVGGPAAELVWVKLFGIKQVELLPEDQVVETSLNLLDLLLVVRKSTLGSFSNLGVLGGFEYLSKNPLVRL